jgi:hypothetical protein
MPDTLPLPSVFPRLWVAPADDDQAAVDLAELAAIPATASLFEPPPTDDAIATNALFVPRFLVVLNGITKDAPVGLFELREEAVEFARAVRLDPEPYANHYYEAIGTPLFKGGWIAVAVVEFSGPVPMHRTDLFEID